MRQVVSLILMMGILTHLMAGGQDRASVTSEISGMPLGTNIELRLKSGQKLRGARGSLSDTGFALVDSRGGEQKVAFDDVASVKRFTIKHHTARNILIGVGIAVVAMAIVVAVELRCGPFGCK
jgi:hypothetical protein